MHEQTAAGIVSITRQQMHTVVSRLEVIPMPKQVNTDSLCVYMPSTALTMDPSGPRSAKPVPITVMQVVMDTQRRFATKVTTEKM
mmetsp:Transcript_20448/g.57875  ORF Transcript_20448/g.57875 Transcript_20448/m.57875 type:complete len:85 (-) Transcript_20448:303-557(-)